MLGFPSGFEYGVEDFLQAWVLRVASMEFHETRGAFRIEKKLQRVLCRGFRGSQRVESRAGVNLKVLAPTFVIGRTRRDHLQQRLGQRQNIRLQRLPARPKEPA